MHFERRRSQPARFPSAAPCVFDVILYDADGCALDVNRPPCAACPSLPATERIRMPSITQEVMVCKSRRRPQQRTGCPQSPLRTNGLAREDQ
jgi:hypothetical protein